MTVWGFFSDCISRLHTNQQTMPAITLTVLAGPAAGSTCTHDSSKPMRVGRVKAGNSLAIKDCKCPEPEQLLMLLWLPAD
jgi:hypothetical protein